MPKNRHLLKVKIRIQKILADRGISSRREGEKLIADGYVLVNNKIAQIGEKADPEADIITVKKSVLEKKAAEKIVVALWKPVGFVTSTKKTAVENRIIFDLLPRDFPRVFPVGRLDKDSSGLLLLTNDGKIAFEITHPKFSHQKVYEVLLTKPVIESDLEKIRRGEMRILGQKIKPAPVKVLGGARVEIILREGKNRQIRRIFRALGSGVKKLRRVAIGELFLKDLGIKEGEFRILTAEEIGRIFKEKSAKSKRRN